uniref:Macaca fascicularis brain cDNA clone: QorA-13975, similar to human filamin-binding LIM protein-1 (FBLP-1), mRNA, RefSeq: NM_017556.1 n=1 Tax=Macaca fascicularis TaxID=9541 RepID=I7GLJ1_MACFA|nr:unnamed protein product [Macaca fascicularis]
MNLGGCQTREEHKMHQRCGDGSHIHKDEGLATAFTDLTTE